MRTITHLSSLMLLAYTLIHIILYFSYAISALNPKMFAMGLIYALLAYSSAHVAEINKFIVNKIDR